MKKKILLTRPRVASARWNDLLTRHGFEAITEPLLTITSTSTPRPSGNFQAILITSANAADALEDIEAPLSDLLWLPCFCVGSATSDAARASGFRDIRCGTSDSTALVRMTLLSLRDKSRPLLHISGDKVDGKASDLLAKNGYTLVPWVVYQAEAVEDFTPQTKELFSKGAFAAIPVFSPRSARVLVSIIEKNRLSQACSSIIALGLSQAVADVLQTLPWRRLHVAASPDEKDVLASLEFAMTQPEIITPPPPSVSKKKSGLIGFMLGIILLLIGSLVTLASYPYLHLPTQHQISPSDFAALEKRVDVLEAHFKQLTEIPPATSNPVDTATLSDLENKVAQLESRNEQTSALKSSAASFAFFDLREVAKDGHSFVSQLATLRATSPNDPVVNEEATKLDVYAGTPTPTLVALREGLKNLEASLPDEGTQADNSWIGRLQKIMLPLISVHPLQNPRLDQLKSALDDGNAQTAMEAFSNLPSDIQSVLAVWHDKLIARAAIDASLEKLTAHFTEPVAPGSAS